MYFSPYLELDKPQHLHRMSAKLMLNWQRLFKTVDSCWPVAGSIRLSCSFSLKIFFSGVQIKSGFDPRVKCK